MIPRTQRSLSRSAEQYRRISETTVRLPNSENKSRFTYKSTSLLFLIVMDK